MTVKELRALLKEHPEDVDVLLPHGEKLADVGSCTRGWVRRGFPHGLGEPPVYVDETDGPTTPRNVLILRAQR